MFAILYNIIPSTSIHGDFADHIRLGFCHYDVQTLKDAAIRLVQAIKFMQNGKK